MLSFGVASWVLISSPSEPATIRKDMAVMMYSMPTRLWLVVVSHSLIENFRYNFLTSGLCDVCRGYILVAKPLAEGGWIQHFKRCNHECVPGAATEFIAAYGVV